MKVFLCSPKPGGGLYMSRTKPERIDDGVEVHFKFDKTPISTTPGNLRERGVKGSELPKKGECVEVEMR